MEINIIQHHEPFDFESFFKSIESQYVGSDCRDYSNFIHNAGKKHSFMGCAHRGNRVKNALANAIASSKAIEIINIASSVMIIILHSSEAEHPITIKEVQYLSEFVSDFPPDCEVVWRLVDDTSLDGAIKVILLVTTNK